MDGFPGPATESALAIEVLELGGQALRIDSQEMEPVDQVGAEPGIGLIAEEREDVTSRSRADQGRGRPGLPCGEPIGGLRRGRRFRRSGFLGSSSSKVGRTSSRCHRATGSSVGERGGVGVHQEIGQEVGLIADVTRRGGSRPARARSPFDAGRGRGGWRPGVG